MSVIGIAPAWQSFKRRPILKRSYLDAEVTELSLQAQFISASCAPATSVRCGFFIAATSRASICINRIVLAFGGFFSRQGYVASAGRAHRWGVISSWRKHK
jgi:hypothetical protein